MLLRASGRHQGQDYDLTSVVRDQGDSGVPHSDLLRMLTEQAIGGEWSRLAQTRSSAARIMGEQEVTDALIVAAAFNGITRVADATGIPLDHNTEAETVAMRASVGIDDYAYARKSARFPP